MKKNTRDNLLDEAEVLFSEKGFYGTSIQDVATVVGVSKQGLLHHFPTKEKLYAGVLERASENLRRFVAEALDDATTADKQLLSFFQKLSLGNEEVLRIVSLLLRELLDNRERADNAHKWFLRPFLDSLVAIVEQGQEQGLFSNQPPLPFVYQLLGATQYYLISKPTLSRLYSDSELLDLQTQHLALLKAQLICS